MPKNLVLCHLHLSRRVTFSKRWILAWKFAGTPPGWILLMWCHLEDAKDAGEQLRGQWVTVGDEGNWGKSRLVFILYTGPG